MSSKDNDSSDATPSPPDDSSADSAVAASASSEAGGASLVPLAATATNNESAQQRLPRVTAVVEYKGNWVNLFKAMINTAEKYQVYNFADARGGDNGWTKYHESLSKDLDRYHLGKLAGADQKSAQKKRLIQVWKAARKEDKKYRRKELPPIYKQAAEQLFKYNRTIGTRTHRIESKKRAKQLMADVEDKSGLLPAGCKSLKKHRSKRLDHSAGLGVGPVAAKDVYAHYKGQNKENDGNAANSTSSTSTSGSEDEEMRKSNAARKDNNEDISTTTTEKGTKDSKAGTKDDNEVAIEGEVSGYKTMHGAIESMAKALRDSNKTMIEKFESRAATANLDSTLTDAWKRESEEKRKESEEKRLRRQIKILSRDVADECDGETKKMLLEKLQKLKEKYYKNC